MTVIWKQGKGHARSVLDSITREYGEAFVVEWLEQRLGGGDVPKNKPDEPLKVGDTVRVLPRKPGQERQHAHYSNEMREHENNCYLVSAEGPSWCGHLVLSGMPTYEWHPDWLEKVEE